MSMTVIHDSWELRCSTWRALIVWLSAQIQKSRSFKMSFLPLGIKTHETVNFDFLCDQWQGINLRYCWYTSIYLSVPFHSYLTIASALLSFWKLKTFWLTVFIIVFTCFPPPNPSTLILRFLWDSYKKHDWNTVQVPCYSGYVDLPVGPVDACRSIIIWCPICILLSPPSLELAYRTRNAVTITILQLVLKHCLAGNPLLPPSLEWWWQGNKEKWEKIDMYLGGDTFPFLVTTCSCLHYVWEELLYLLSLLLRLHFLMANLVQLCYIPESLGCLSFKVKN